jgi:citrate synthase
MSAETVPAPKTATLTYEGKTITLPVITGSEAESAVDIQKLRAATGLITMDPGFGNTSGCRSAITFIDGEKGILRYRGYDIADLAEHSTFLEVAWLLLYGNLPKAEELKAFSAEITRHTLLNENFRRFFDALPKDAHPMPVCAAAVAALATFYQGGNGSAENTHDTVIRLIAKMPTVAAYSYKHSIGQPFMYPVNKLEYSSNFLHMMFATP